MQDISAHLDALALISDAQAGNLERVMAMVATYQGDSSTDAERGELLGALIGAAASILTVSSAALGIDPAKVLGAVVAHLREADHGDT